MGSVRLYGVIVYLLTLVLARQAGRQTSDAPTEALSDVFLASRDVAISSSSGGSTTLLAMRCQLGQHAAIGSDTYAEQVLLMSRVCQHHLAGLEIKAHIAFPCTIAMARVL
jgi:hypothetical protein